MVTLSPKIGLVPTVSYNDKVTYHNGRKRISYDLESNVEDLLENISDGGWGEPNDVDVNINWNIRAGYDAEDDHHVTIGDIDSNNVNDALTEIENHSEIQKLLSQSGSTYTPWDGIIVVSAKDFGPLGTARQSSLTDSDAVGGAWKGGDNAGTIAHEIAHIAGAEHNDSEHLGVWGNPLDNRSSIMAKPDVSGCDNKNPHDYVTNEWSDCEEQEIREFTYGRLS